MFLHQNLTPLYFGPKLTSRKPPQLEVTLFVRGTWRIPLEGPLEAIEDPIEQGFMSGDVFDDADTERTGALLYASDFADFKLHADLVLKGTCHVPGGVPTDYCKVSFAVGDWSKSLLVVGPRVWKPGLLKASMSDPVTFTRMPLTWQNAFGGEGHAANPCGKGIAGEELPTVELEDKLIRKRRDKPAPACFGAINANWQQRADKRGKEYGDDYQKNRAPFFSKDFDWTHFQAAPEDQQLPGYLRGDEKLSFTNLHPEAPQLQTQLPGQRVRCFLKYKDERFAEVAMQLDTLFVDMDERKLNLTWRGLAPVEHREFDDIACGLVVAEKLGDPPLSLEHYREILDKYEADPLGLDDKFPPGFLEMAKSIEKEEAAELAGSPVPMDKRVDPFGIRAAFPAGALAAYEAGSDDPLDVKSKFPDGLLDLQESLQVGEVPTPAGLEGRAELAGLDESELLMLNMVPEEQRPTILEQLASAKQSVGEPGSQVAPAVASGGDAPSTPEVTLFSMMGTSMAVPTAPPAMPPIPDDMNVEDPRPMLEDLSQQLKQKKQNYIDKGIDHPLLSLFDRGQRMITNAAAMAAGMLDGKTAPNGPDLSEAKQALQQATEKLDDVPGEDEHKQEKESIDAALAAIAKMETAFPPKPTEVHDDERDFFGQDLRGQDFSGQDLSGKSFAKANLGGTNLSGATLIGANFREANLCKADFSKADLSNARFQETALLQTRLRGARLDGAVFARCGLGAADLRDASLVGVDLSGCNCEAAQFGNADLSGSCARGTVFRKADLTGASLIAAKLEEADFSWAQGMRAKFRNADLSKAALVRAEFAEADFSGAVMIECNLEHASLSRACLDGANLESCLAEHVDLSQATLKAATLRFAVANKALLEGADFTGADLAMASMILSRADRAVFSEAKLGLTKLSRSRLRGSVYSKCKGEQAQLDKCDLREADLRTADMGTCNFGESDLTGADFREASLVKASLRGVKAIGADFRRANLTCAALSEHADFSQADFRCIEAPGSIWMHATLNGADLSWAKLAGAFFNEVQARDVKFAAADLTGASFRKAKLDTPYFMDANLNRLELSMATVLAGEFLRANCYGMILHATELARCDFTAAFVEAIHEDKDTVRA
ncbi:MAG: hypothetical protein ACI91B_001108 [Planctomycetota bacterium]|jgi:uncharacterized protein YjbI with pentapeptide repeats